MAVTQCSSPSDDDIQTPPWVMRIKMMAVSVFHAFAWLLDTSCQTHWLGSAQCSAYWSVLATATSLHMPLSTRRYTAGSPSSGTKSDPRRGEKRHLQLFLPRLWDAMDHVFGTQGKRIPSWITPTLLLDGFFSATLNTHSHRKIGTMCQLSTAFSTTTKPKVKILVRPPSSQLEEPVLRGFICV